MSLPLKNGCCNSFVSIKALCRQLHIDRGTFFHLSQESQSLYTYGAIRKGDKTRDLDKPSRELKALQKAINRLLLRRYEWPHFLHGAVRGRSALTNAEVHAGNACLAKLDIRDYFPSISHRQVNEAWRSIGFSPSISHHLTKLTTYAGHLPQGAPTSSAIANLILLPRELPFVERIEATGHVYTRYIDDIAISGPQAHQYVQGAVEIVQRSGFRVKHRKTKVERRSGPQELTGFSLNSGHASVTQKYRREVRRRISKLSAFNGSELQAEIQSLMGCIAYVRLTNPKAAERLERYLEMQIA